MPLNETHDPSLRSFDTSANDPGTDFPIQNLPFCSFRRRRSGDPFGIGVAIGTDIVDLKTTLGAGAFGNFTDARVAAQAAATSGALNGLMELGGAHWSTLRLALSRILRSDAPSSLRTSVSLVPQREAEYAIPVRIGHFTDFYASIHHAVSCGKLFRPDTPLYPNYRWLPVGYQSRASSIRLSGHPLHRPNGQMRIPGSDTARFGPSQKVDFEVELGVFVGTGSELGHPIPLDDVENHLFGVNILNDWSARDIQQWETMPLGPFVSKGWGSTISPWVVTLEALEPYRSAYSRPASDPELLPYLWSPRHGSRGHFDVNVEVYLLSEQMRARGEQPSPITSSNTRYLYWSVLQMLTHHTCAGCDLAPGDFYGSGTLSGPEASQAGSLLELSFNGTKDIELANGERRTFIQDGDTVIMKAFAERNGPSRIGLGTCEAQILPAIACQ
jgi:fumarylacetoacetase